MSEHPLQEDDPNVPRFMLKVGVNTDGTCNIGLGNVEPGHLSRIFSADMAQAIEHALFTTASANGPVEELPPHLKE